MSGSLQNQVDQLQLRLHFAMQEINRLKKQNECLKNQALKEAMCAAMPQAIQYAERQVHAYVHQQHRMILRQQQQIKYLLEQLEKRPKSCDNDNDGDKLELEQKKSQELQGALEKMKGELENCKKNLEKEKKAREECQKKLKDTEEKLKELQDEFDKFKETAKKRESDLCEFIAYLCNGQKKTYNFIRPVIIDYFEREAKMKAYYDAVLNEWNKFVATTTAAQQSLATELQSYDDTPLPLTVDVERGVRTMYPFEGKLVKQDANEARVLIGNVKNICDSFDAVFFEKFMMMVEEVDKGGPPAAAQPYSGSGGKSGGSSARKPASSPASPNTKKK